MKITVKVMRALLEDVRRDLVRPHPFADERVGFFVAGASETPDGILLAICGYQSVADEDYERNPMVGAQIGPDAMRKAVEAAFRPQRSLLHVHTHGRSGSPEFSPVDLQSAEEFVPGFLRPVPRMPHCLLVLSDDSAIGLLWKKLDEPPLPITDFVIVGAPYARNWRTS